MSELKSNEQKAIYRVAFEFSGRFFLYDIQNNLDKGTVLGVIELEGTDEEPEQSAILVSNGSPNDETALAVYVPYDRFSLDMGCEIFRVISEETVSKK